MFHFRDFPFGFHKAVLIYYTQATSVSNKNLSSIGIRLSNPAYYQLIKLEFRIIPLHSVVMVKTQGITLLMWNTMFNTSMTWLNTLHITTAHPWEVRMVH
jgi:hypothetical protein